MVMKSSTSIPNLDQVFAGIERQMGFVPNLFREMGQNPAVLQVYLKGQEALTHGVLTQKEQQAVQLAVAARNDCHYCQAAHQWLGGKMGVSQEDLQSIRSGVLPADHQLANIVRATNLLLTNKGWVDPEELNTWEKQGIDRAKVYEIVAFIGLKTLSNYINHLAHTPIDEQFGAENQAKS